MALQFVIYLGTETLGDSHHMTSQGTYIHQYSPFEGLDQIYIGNGQGLHVLSTDSSTIIPLIIANLILSSLIYFM